MAMRHRTTAIAAVALMALAVPVTAGCGAVEKAMDCAQTAVTISNSVEDLQQAVSGAAEDPTQAQNALDRIDKNLDSLGDKTDNADIGKAVDDMNTGVKNARDSLDQGKTPDLTPITDAAQELTKVCSPG
ncbi:hypothetical protein [Streptomyces sp. 8N706]|uniref:hypothetical protein n=1 Tax=Streptomyces sp. 8N706 TaxID=3457416 RepID=UPI003FD52072